MLLSQATLWSMVGLLVVVQRTFAKEYNCIDHGANDDVDWFVIYKMKPTIGVDEAQATIFADGLGYFYLNPKTLVGWTKSTIGIGTADQTLERTLKPYYDAPADQDTLRIWYSSQSISLPNCPKSPSQGVIMSKADAAMWLTHSVPSFPPTDKFKWPDGKATENSQLLFCLSLDLNTLKSVVEALRYEMPIVYWQHLPAAFQVSPYLEIVTGEPVTAQSKVLYFTTKGFKPNEQLSMRYIVKTGKNIKLFDNLMATGQRIPLKTWTKHNLKSACSVYYKVINIKDGVRIVQGSSIISIDRQSDDARWAVSDNPVTPLWCFTASDRTSDEAKAPGSALCTTNLQLYNIFGGMAAMANSEKC
uniref:Deoxyribonuclease II n=1 Tax=Trichuris muris TaxID=70415 RepID=A0A5S6Q096_TRIMR